MYIVFWGGSSVLYNNVTSYYVIVYVFKSHNVN